MVGNLGQAIAILPIGPIDQPLFGSSSLKQLPEGRALCLRLPPGNLAEHAIRLMPCNERLRPEIDLPAQLGPRARSLAPLAHKLPIALLRRSLPGTKLGQNSLA